MKEEMKRAIRQLELAAILTPLIALATDNLWCVFFGLCYGAGLYCLCGERVKRMFRECLEDAENFERILMKK